MKALIKKIIQKIFRKTHIPVEPEDLIEKRRIFYGSFAGKNDLVFDIGANYGNRVEPFYRNGCRVVAVEPQPECVKYLKKKYKNKIAIEGVGIGANKGKLDFHISSWPILSTFSNEFINKTNQSGRFNKNLWNKTIKVNLITLDDLILKYGSPKFIKVDVEGYEEEVFKGLTQKVKFISFEYTLPELAGSLVQILVKLNLIAPIEINFSVGESMKLELNDWINCQQFIDSFKNDSEFSKQLKNFGDIYVRYSD